MDIRKLQRAIVDGLEDVKAQNIVVFNTEHLSALFERVIIASGTSNRQTRALASSVRDSVRQGGMPVLATEGAVNGEWIIVDCGAAVAHIMQPAIRDYYRLEEIWGGKPVAMKLGEVRMLPKAEEPAAALPAAKAVPQRKKPAPAKTATRTAAKKAVARPASLKSPASKRPAAKVAVAQRAGARSAGAKRPATGRQTVKAAPAKSAPRKSAPAKSGSAKYGSPKRPAAARKPPRG